jgi:hypothetical protein
MLFSIVSFMQPTLIFMHNKRYRDEELVEMTRNFIKEAVEEARVRFTAGNELPLEVSVNVLRRLKNLKILISLEDFGEEKLTEFYRDLKLQGDEGFLETFLEIKKFNVRVRNEKESSWRKKIEELVQLHRISYEIEKGNVLCEYFLKIFEEF